MYTTLRAQVGSSDDRRNALESGLLSLVVKLLQARHPLPVSDVML